MDANKANHVPAPLEARHSREQLIERFSSIREFSQYLVEPLKTEDFVAQAKETTSPVKWHLAHVSWFFEKFILEKVNPDYRPFHPQYDHLFNSYYLQPGIPHKRSLRGLLTRPTVKEVFQYREYIDEQIMSFLEETDGERLAEFGPVIEMGFNHEQQHQELMLTDLKYLFSQNPLNPAYRSLDWEKGNSPPDLKWKPFEEGVYHIGNNGKEFAYDNEHPRHRVFLEPFKMSNRLITNREYREFINDGGYNQSSLWLDDGWEKIRSRGWQAPLFWEETDGEWFYFTLGGRKKINPNEPVVHLSYYEADAFARWTGNRLPSEEEWEVAAENIPLKGNFVDARQFHPRPSQEGNQGLQQMYGDAWEWTMSAHVPYPGYKPPKGGALGEYNSKFMCNQYVLRGGSWATSKSHIRKTYRNFLYPDARWQCNGIRLAQTI